MFQKLKLRPAPLSRLATATAALGLALAAFAPAAGAETIYANTTSNRLISFSSEDPCGILSSVKVSGLEEGEALLGIDFRPLDGTLYGLGSTSRVYTIDETTGFATAVNALPFTPPLDGTDFGFDFNPTVDRIRIVSNTGQNLRYNPLTGAIAFVDGDLAYVAGDANEGAAPSATGAAYTNPDNDPATGTTLYDVDSGLAVLATQNPPNSGTLNTVGSLGLSTNDLVGFDISSSGSAFAALKVTGKRDRRGCGGSRLVRVDLGTGAVTSLGSIGVPAPIRGLAVPTP